MSEENRLKLENELLFTKSKAQMINLYLDLQQKVEQLEKQNEKLKAISKRIRKAIDNDEDDLLYVLFDIQDIIQDDEEQKLAYDRYIKPYIE